MKEAAKPKDEQKRLDALYEYKVLDTQAERGFDDLAQIASSICKTSIALISLVDKKRQWFKSKIGLDISETPRELAFCSHTILQDDVFEIPNTLEDNRFADNPLVSDQPNIRFYAGVPLKSSSGHNIGTLCVIDQKPKKLSQQQGQALQALARQIINLLELRLANGESQKPLEAETMFLTHIGQEIRTPLNDIIGSSHMLLQKKLDDESDELLSSIHTSGQSLLYLINDVLDLSKLEFKKVELEPESFHLQSFLKETIELFMAQANSKGLNLKYYISRSIPKYIHCDSNRLKQILYNFLNNAIKFTEKGKIEIFIKDISERDDLHLLQFSIRDTGFGISQEDQKKLFKPFSLIDSSDTKKDQGTGLGLAICKKLVQLMGGDVYLESDKGKGSTFIFTIEAQLAGQEVKEFTSFELDAEMAQKHPLSILIVEDNRTNQIVIKKLLARMGYEAETAFNGLEALEAIKNGSFDFTLMDCHMPEMDGHQATQEIIKRWPSPQERPYIVALTASELKEDKEKCQKSGMDGFLSKPVSLEKLYEELLKVIPKFSKAS